MNYCSQKIRFCIVFAVLLFSPIGLTNAEDIEPGGVFFHSFTGPFSAVEWAHIRSRPGDSRYQFSDVRGLAPYHGTIAGTGDITWDDTGNTSGSGLFTSQNDAPCR